MVFALCGGDERAVRLAALLLAGGHGVRAWALEGAQLPGGARRCESAEECCRGADCVVLPMPMCALRGMLNAPLSQRPRCLGEVFAACGAGCVVCGGAVGEDAREMAAGAHVRLRDYGALESFRAANSAATAEGAIGVLLRETPGLLCGREALLIGAGRVARALAPRLRGLGLGVTMASRSADSRAWARALGFGACAPEELSQYLPCAGIVVNTAPALVLTASRLTELAPDALVLDLASAPGGTDFEAAKAFGIRALTAPGLPAKWSPEAAAAAVRDAVYRIMEDETT